MPQVGPDIGGSSAGLVNLECQSNFPFDEPCNSGWKYANNGKWESDDKIRLSCNGNICVMK